MRTKSPWVLKEVMGHSHVIGSDNKTVVGFSTNGLHDRHVHDARLIAVAPELLAFIQYLYNENCNHHHNDRQISDNEIETMKTLIKKSKGIKDDTI